MTTQSDVRFMFDSRIPMRDGVELSADIYLPAEVGRFPAILQRTPYDNTMPLWVGISKFFASHGYVFVSQDVRGRCDSDGKWDPFRNEGPDGYDTIEWIAQQPWCNGKIGMMGGSYGGFVQWMAAREQPPHLVTMVSTAAAGRMMQEFPYSNGKMGPYIMFWLNLTGGHTLQTALPGAGGTSLVNWKKLVLHRPFKDIDIALGRLNTVWREWLAHPTFDDYWRKLSLLGHFHKIGLPVLHVTGWFDGDQWGELFYLNHMLAESPGRDRQWLLSGPWDHGGTRTPRPGLGGIEFGQSAVLDMNEVHLRWFDFWLKGIQNGQGDDPKVKIFIMGRNQWRTEPTWPLPDTKLTPYYFHSGGRANTLGGDGKLSSQTPKDEPADSYSYDPDNATPSMQDIESFPGGEQPLDERWIERRDDVLVYTSEPLTEEVEVTGTPWVHLYTASDCVDTDFGAVLCDVYPDGRSIALTEGMVRASFRESLERPTLITPGRVYEYKIELMATSNAFLPGHRIRVTVLSARFPGVDRNPNTGAPVGEDSEVKIAHQTLYHTAAHPSRVVLPVIPRRPADKKGGGPAPWSR